MWPTPKILLFCKYFAETCMKMKEFGPRGGRLLPLLRSANEMTSNKSVFLQSSCLRTGLPIRLFVTGAYVLTLLHCLSGAVFLGTFLLHLLPEAVTVTNQILPEDVTYPVTEMIAAVGMFLMLLLEQVRFIPIIKLSARNFSTLGPSHEFGYYDHRADF